MEFSAIKIAGIIEGTTVNLDTGSAFTRVIIDSRDAGPGDLFVALPGESVDGHDFVADAAARGASVALVDREIECEIGQIVVEDTGAALLELAAYRRSLFEGKTVAVTGSCGKTTTKDMLVSVLSEKYRVHGPRGNYNTELGVPLTILAMPEDTDVLALELGVSAPGDMDILGAISYPDIAVITCVGATHTEFLDDAEGVAREKGRLIEYIVSGGIVVLNADDELVLAMANMLPEDISFATFGLSATADTFASDIIDEGIRGITFKLDGLTECRLSVPGLYNVYNALAAAAVAKELGVKRDEICGAIEGFEPGDMRSQIIEYEGVIYIIDCYNSSPKAARAALDNLAASRSEGRAWAILGEMRELGDIAEGEHRALGRLAAELNFDFIIGYGEGGRTIIEGVADAGYTGEARSFDSYRDTAEFIIAEIKAGDIALFKASRGVELENVLRIIGVIR